MNIRQLVISSEQQVTCAMKVQNTFESLHAHVELPDGVDVMPGDSVIVHGEPIKVPYGECHFETRQATIVRASFIERTWTRWTGDLEFMELCEFSFSEEKQL
ncbi:MAG: hypothetical protein KKB37_12790 [Alphaproteobacteria bacterium]|nr:hypothetical protein [Alphaproteobacteria bacterium]